MHFLEKFLYFLHTASLPQVAGLIFCINLFQLVFVLLVGEWLTRHYAHRSVSDAPGQLSWAEPALAALTLFLNSGITLIGFALWRHGYIIIANGSLSSMVADMVVFILFIDLSMYILHRIAHWKVIFRWLHGTHHKYEDPRPITLFVLNPLETLSFGMLWLVILVWYPSSWPGVFLFLTFNLLFGMMGHLGVEPLADSLFRKYYIQLFSTSTFHAMHHKTGRYNFGFYLVLWDRLLHTLQPGYYEVFRGRK